MSLGENPPENPYRQYLIAALSQALDNKEEVADRVLDQGEIGDEDGKTQESAVTVKAPNSVVAILLCKAWLLRYYPDARGSRSSLSPGGKLYDHYIFSQPVKGATEIWFDLRLTDM